MWWRCWLLFCRRLLAVLLRILGRVVDDHAKLAGTQVAWHEAQTHDALLPASEQADHRLLQRGGARLQLLLERLDAAASPLLARAIRLPPSPLALARRPAQLELFRAQPAPSCSTTSHSTHQLLASPFAHPTRSLSASPWAQRELSASDCAQRANHLRHRRRRQCCCCFRRRDRQERHCGRHHRYS